MLKSISHNELITFFEKLSQYSMEPLFISDNDFRIVYANGAFENLVQKSSDEIINMPFGNALGCRYIDKGGENCGNNYYCKICTIRDSIKSCLLNTNKSFLNQVVRDFNLGDEIIFKYMRFSSFSVTLMENTHAVIVITESLSNPDISLTEV